MINRAAGTSMQFGAWFTSPTHRVGMNRVEASPGGAGGLLGAHPGGGEPCPIWVNPALDNTAFMCDIEVTKRIQLRASVPKGDR